MTSLVQQIETLVTRISNNIQHLIQINAQRLQEQEYLEAEKRLQVPVSPKEVETYKFLLNKLKENYLSFEKKELESIEEKFKKAEENYDKAVLDKKEEREILRLNEEKKRKLERLQRASDRDKVLGIIYKKEGETKTLKLSSIEVAIYIYMYDAVRLFKTLFPYLPSKEVLISVDGIMEFLEGIFRSISTIHYPQERFEGPLNIIMGLLQKEYGINFEDVIECEFSLGNTRFFELFVNQFKKKKMYLIFKEINGLSTSERLDAIKDIMKVKIPADLFHEKGNRAVKVSTPSGKDTIMFAISNEKDKDYLFVAATGWRCHPINLMKSIGK